MHEDGDDKDDDNVDGRCLDHLMVLIIFMKVIIMVNW